MRFRRVARLPTSLLLGTVAWMVGCITVPEFRTLERDVERLKRGGGSTDVGAQVPDTRIAELGAQVDSLEREVARLRGAIEVASHSAEEARRLAEEARELAAGGLDSPAAPQPSGLGPVPTGFSTAVSEEVKEYEAAFATYRAGEYRDAIDRFKAFLQNYPSSEYSDNSLFWIGECQFRLGDYERAVLTFEDVVKKYPDGNKVPDALYRQGVALIEIGRKNREEEVYAPAAREIFERIVKEHPSSTRVPEAEKQLEKLRL